MNIKKYAKLHIKLGPLIIIAGDGEFASILSKIRDSFQLKDSYYLHYNTLQKIIFSFIQ